VRGHHSQMLPESLPIGFSVGTRINTLSILFIMSYDVLSRFFSSLSGVARRATPWQLFFFRSHAWRAFSEDSGPIDGIACVWPMAVMVVPKGADSCAPRMVGVTRLTLEIQPTTLAGHPGRGKGSSDFVSRHGVGRGLQSSNKAVSNE